MEDISVVLWNIQQENTSEIEDTEKVSFLSPFNIKDNLINSTVPIHTFVRASNS